LPLRDNNLINSWLDQFGIDKTEIDNFKKSFNECK
jgi:hypothetical protein